MRKILFILASIALIFSINTDNASAGWVNGYYRSNGTYVSGYYRGSSSIKSYSVPSYSSGLRYQNGYYKPSTGTWVEGHYKTYPDGYTWNNRKNLYGW